jgi:hypothetical protein
MSIYDRRTQGPLIFTSIEGRGSSQELLIVKCFAIAFAFTFTSILVKWVVFFDGINPYGNNDRGPRLFCFA